MHKYIAIINNNLVDSVVVGDDTFLSHIQDKHQFVVDVTNRDRPSPGDSYYSDQDAFISNSVEVNHLPDLGAEHLISGTEDGFESFRLSNYSVSYKEGMVTIGCKKYSARGLLGALHKSLTQKHKSVERFTTHPTPGHGKYEITWADAKILYDALKKVKL